MTTCETRYQVCCSACESVGFEPARYEALLRANRHANNCDGLLTVFDRMARKGCTSTWTLDRGWNGAPVLKPIGIREAA